MPRFANISTVLVALCVSASLVSAQDTQPPARLPATKVVGENTKAVTVQNDRNTAVTLYVDVGRVDRAIGTVDAGATTTLELPEWATRGERTVKLVARTDRDARAVASYALPVNEGRSLGLLVPPAAGLPVGDSILVTLPKGSANAATVTIDNQRAQPVAVFAEKGLLFVRLGDVAANGQGTLVIPDMLTKAKGDLRVFARPADAASVSTKALRLEAGDHIAVIVM